jgi:hypothetical protein
MSISVCTCKVIAWEDPIALLHPPCDFDAFVAQRRGISCEQAERLVQSWLKQYCPERKPVIDIAAQPDSEVQSLTTSRRDARPVLSAGDGHAF